MKRVFLFALILCFLGSAAMADWTTPTALTYQNQVQELTAVPIIDAPAVDLARVVAEDEARLAAGGPERFAIPNQVSIDVTQFGLWEEVDANTSLWRLQVRSENAPHINLGFTSFHMPAGGRLLIYADDLSTQIRPFTADDNYDHGQLWTPILRADGLVLEVTVPTFLRDELQLKLGSINVGYRGFGAGEPGDDTFLSGSCNIDVVCPEGDNWRSEIPAIAVISRGGSLNCSGFMVNNTAEDQRPFFMTARHCGVTSSNASSLVAYWNYETSTCGGTPDGTLDQFNTGSTWRSSYSPSDFTLVELSASPDPAYGVTFAGWDVTGADASSAVAIHHPSVDEKRISFENQPTTTTSYLGTSVPGDGTHVRVADWDDGTTEGGSSGSPLFDQNHRVIGQLHGGYAACGNNLADWYGKMSVSWTGGGTNSSRLSNWLDPIGTGQTTLDTLDPNGGGSCTSNSDCDNGLFCDGQETCNTGSGNCQSGSNPCSSGQTCDEAADQCVDPPACAPKGASCSSNSDCCGNKCRGKRNNKSCK